MEAELGVNNANQSALLDDDGKPRRTGTMWSASAHIITAVIGAGVLSLAWAMAQLGWILGISSILVFAAVTLYTSNLLADCYRFPDPVSGKRNSTYMDAIKTHLGGKMHMICGIVQYTNLAGIAISYTITTSISVVTILKNDCLRKNGAEACHFSYNPYMIGLGIIEIILSQIPNFHKLAWLSFLAAFMSFGYAFIGIGLSLTTIIQGHGRRSTSLFLGSNEQNSSERYWNLLVALGNIALANSYAQISIDIQDTLKSSPPENKVMKMANKVGIMTMTVVFLLCGCSGYAAFGRDTPGSILMSTSSHNPLWLIDLGNAFIIVHLLGAYQVVVQPVYHIVEIFASQRWSKSSFITREYNLSIGKLRVFSINYFRLIWRSMFVVLATVLAMAMPFFNDMIALLGAIGFWPLVVYFPIEMIIVKQKIKKRTVRWFGLQSLSAVCMIVSVAAAIAAIHGLGQSLGKYKPFMYKA